MRLPLPIKYYRLLMLLPIGNNRFPSVHWDPRGVTWAILSNKKPAPAPTGTGYIPEEIQCDNQSQEHCTSSETACNPNICTAVIFILKKEERRWQKRNTPKGQTDIYNKDVGRIL